MGEMGWCGDGVEEVGRAGKIDDSDQRAYYISDSHDLSGI